MSFISLLIQAFSLLILVFLALPNTEAKSTEISEACANPLTDYSYQTCPPSGGRYDAERIRLLKHIDRGKGKWDKKHPRWQILEALQGFDRYASIVGHEIDRFQDLYKHVSKKHRQILESTIGYHKNFPEAHTLLGVNAKFCSEVVSFALDYYSITRHELETFIEDTDDGKAKSGLRVTVSQTLKHMVRNWSPEGHAEREATFSYILDALTTNLPPPEDLNRKHEILVPGAGLGRLAHDIALLGPHMSVTSNEWSSSMNMAYRYLTSLTSPTSIMIHPFLESWSHARTRNDLTRPVTIIPNPHGSENLLVEGDFAQSFHTPNHYSAISTLFFIDTARNIVSYLEMIHSLLKPRGLWINVGPLLYGTAPLVQLSLDEVVAIAEKIGFEFEESSWEEKQVLYNFNQSTLYRHGYVAQCWVARKKVSSEPRKVDVGKSMLEKLRKSVVG